MHSFRGIACAAVLALAAAGCGGSSSGPRLRQTDAARLIALTHRIAGEGACAQSSDIPKLQTEATALVNAHRVPAALEEPLMNGVHALGAEAPMCLPSVPAATTTSTPPAPAPKHAPHPHPPHGPGHGHGHGHGHDK